MIIGFCGAGNMAAAMARGWEGKFERMLFSDSGSGRAAALARRFDGDAVSNAELAQQADLVVLAVKPAKLGDVAAELGAAKAVMSVLAGTSLDQVRRAFPRATVCRVMPNIPVEVQKGVLCLVGEYSPEVRSKLELLGWVVDDLLESEFDVATAVMGCAPAYLALAVEAIISAGADTDLGEQQTKDLVVKTMAGTAEVLKDRSPAYVRKAVASPGGSTEAGMDELEKAKVRAAFKAAVEASLKRMGP
jgi:pyrroline-5-carboxylate reductase